MGKEAKTNTESEAGPAVAWGDSVAVTGLPCRQSNAAFGPGTLNGEEGEGFSLNLYHFRIILRQGARS